MKTIGLCMIVKNESRVILRCLDSVRPLVDYVLIEDTGSTDGTQDIIRRYLEREGLLGEVFDEPWQDFAHNRSIALARLRERAEIDYAFIIDADDVLVCDESFCAAGFKKGLSKDIYLVPFHDGAVVHDRPQICSNRMEYRYRGVVHEFLEGPKEGSSALATGFHISSRVEGARSQDPDKYPERCGNPARCVGDGAESVPPVTLHVLFGAELAGRGREREGARRLSHPSGTRFLERGESL